MARPGVRTVIDNTAQLLQALRMLPMQQVLVGVPEEKAAREEDEGAEPINNATLAYIHNTGAPEANIPARPFMEPGIKDAQKKIVNYMKQAGKAAVEGKKSIMERALEAAGMTAATSVRNHIDTGPFQPLMEATIRARARRGRKGAIAHMDALAAGQVPAAGLVKPLIDTAQMQKSITYVVRAK